MSNDVGTCRPTGSAWLESGQSTVEYALVLFAFVSTIAALGVMWHAARDGRLLQLGVESSSHGLSSSDALGTAQDILLY